MHVFGRSMAPTLSSGVQIEVRPLTRAPRRGDVVACERAGRLVVHRVVRVQGTEVLTQGDALSTPDPLWSLSDLLGRVALPDHATLRSLPLRSRLRRALRRWG